MIFNLRFSDRAKGQLKNLKQDKGLAKRYKAVIKTLQKLQQNPRYPGLQTHEITTTSERASRKTSITITHYTAMA